MEATGVGLRRALVLVFCVAGIWSAYIYQGILQETLSTKRFGPDGKRFEHLSFLNLAQNVICLVWSYIMINLWSSGSSGGAPWWTYWSAGITNTIGPAMGIEALKYISYPAQVLAKSSKMIPDHSLAVVFPLEDRLLTLIPFSRSDLRESHSIGADLNAIFHRFTPVSVSSSPSFH